MTPKIMCTACRGSGGWGCGKNALRCNPCGGTGEVDLPKLPGYERAGGAAKEGGR